MTDKTPRRGFVRGLGAAVGALAAWPAVGSAEEQSVDESWLKGLTGKHRQLFDVDANAAGRSLGRVMNFMDAYVEAYRLKDSDINAIFGVHGAAVTTAFNDAAWDKYQLGTRGPELDPRTGAPARRNPWASEGASSVLRLQERGVRFIVCHRSVRRISGELAGPNGNAEAIRKDLLANLLPRVTAVPAMIVAVNRAQEAGLTYAYLG